MVSGLDCFSCWVLGGLRWDFPGFSGFGVLVGTGFGWFWPLGSSWFLFVQSWVYLWGTAWLRDSGGLI